MKKSTRAVYTLIRPFRKQSKCKFPDNQDTTPLKLRLMLSEEQLLQEGYPICPRGKFERFVYTKDKYAEVRSIINKGNLIVSKYVYEFLVDDNDSDLNEIRCSNSNLV